MLVDFGKTKTDNAKTNTHIPNITAALAWIICRSADGAVGVCV